MAITQLKPLRRRPRSRLLLAVGLLCACPLGYGQTFTVERAPEWDALFTRTSGWTGADGIYSIPLSGNDAPGSAEHTRTLFVFSDTFVGEVGPDGKRLAGTTLVNNTLAFLQGSTPDPEKAQFVVAYAPNGKPQAVFTPKTRNARPGDWYWLMDGVSLDGNLHIFGLRMKKGDGGVFNFAVAGVALISARLDDPDPLKNHQQVDAPLHFVPKDGRGELIFGGSVMVNTAKAGAPDPDGFVYVYGTQNDKFSKKLLAARVRPKSFSSFADWRFWDGSAWVSNLDTAAPLTGRISSEFSVSPLPDGRYILAFQFDALGRDVAVRIGESPIGPFGPARKIWHCPEPDRDPDIYVYNAKAHPHISAPGELLISYNVNTFDFFDHFRYADIYRPRFIRLRLKQ